MQNRQSKNRRVKAALFTHQLADLYDPTAARIVRLSETGFGDDGETLLTRIKRRRQPRLAVILYGRGKCVALVLFALTGLFRQHMAPV